jgi:branched-chain amino acid transport system permease protein
MAESLPLRARLTEFVRSGPGAGVIATVLMLGVVELFPHRMPGGIYLGNGVVFGAWAGLVTLGLVMVFRSSRIINFAAFQLGATPALLFFGVVRNHWFARLLTLHLHGRHFATWSLTVEYWLAAVLAIGLAAVLSAATYLIVVRRLAGAPPLVGTVATIAISSLLYALQFELIKHWPGGTQSLAGVATPPQNINVGVGGTNLNLGAVLTLGSLVLLPVVELYLRRSRVGTGVRAAADNRDRAATLGVNSAVVTTVVWAIAGALSGLAAVLTVVATGPAAVGGLGGVVPTLVAMVLAGMIGLRIGFFAAIGTGVLSAGLLWSFQDANLITPVLLGVVVVVLLLRKPSRSRVADEEIAWQAAREARPVPPELRGLSDVRRMRVRTAVVVVIAIAIYPFLSPVGAIGAATTVAVMAMVGLSLLVLSGWAGLISLGQFALAAVGGWVVAVLSGSHHISALIALPAAAIAGALVAFIVGLPALRIRGIYLAVLTLTFAAGITTLLLQPQYGGAVLPQIVPRPSLFGLATNDARAFYFVCVVFLLLTLAAVNGIRRSRTGRALIASRENEKYAEIFGVKLVSAQLQAFAVSGAIAAVAGGLFAYQQQSVNAGNFGPSVSLVVLMTVIVGGMGSVAGPVLGAVFVGVLAQFGNTPSTIGLPLAVLFVLAAMPGGLSQLVFVMRDMFLRRIAYRNRIVVPSLTDAAHPGWTQDQKVRLAPPSGYVPERYSLPHHPLTVSSVASTGRGA